MIRYSLFTGIILSSMAGLSGCTFDQPAPTVDAPGVISGAAANTQNQTNSAVVDAAVVNSGVVDTSPPVPEPVPTPAPTPAPGPGPGPGPEPAPI